MLDFSKTFFEKEIREDFTVDSTMKCFWAAELEVLREIAVICERHRLQWCAAYGTLLGAVRHQGFIPWDDDMDIWMKREDYMKFLEVASQELPKGYLIHSPMTERGYLQFHSCVLNASSVSVESKRLQDFHGCPFVVGVDIFPLDTLPDDPVKREEEKTLFDLVSIAATMVNKQERTAENFLKLKQMLMRIETQCQIRIPDELLLPQKKDELVSELQCVGNQIVMKYDKEPGKILVMYMDYINWNQKQFASEWFSEMENAVFEEFYIPIPASYDKILRVIYGDYQKRIRNTSMHGYPMYQKQLDQLRDMIHKLETEKN